MAIPHHEATMLLDLMVDVAQASGDIMWTRRYGARVLHIVLDDKGVLGYVWDGREVDRAAAVAAVQANESAELVH